MCDRVLPWGQGTREKDSVLREDFDLYCEGKTLPREDLYRGGKLPAGRDVHREGKTLCTGRDLHRVELVTREP